MTDMMTPEPRMSIEPSAMRALDAKVAGNPILQNAFRLMCDGDVLFANERHASVVVLRNYSTRRSSSQSRRLLTSRVA